MHSLTIHITDNNHVIIYNIQISQICIQNTITVCSWTYLPVFIFTSPYSNNHYSTLQNITITIIKNILVPNSDDTIPKPLTIIILDSFFSFQNSMLKMQFIQ